MTPNSNNPYAVGPRTFTRQERATGFFGREREARELLRWLSGSGWCFFMPNPARGQKARC